jgi:acyl-CoA dehydrogenase
MGGLQLERLAGAIGAVAGCEHALQYTLQYMSERQAFGKKINQFQVLRHRIADLASEIEATKYFLYHICRVHNEGKYAVKEASMVKLLATELSDKTMYQCLQCFGGYGFIEDYKIARMFRDSRVGTIGGGSSEIMREIISKLVIDDVQYNSPTEENSLNSTNGAYGIEELVNFLQPKIKEKTPIGKNLKFAMGTDGVIWLNGSDNQLLLEDHQADCTIKISLEDLNKMLKGNLNPMNAMMNGQMQVEGDMAVAMQIGKLIQ